MRRSGRLFIALGVGLAIIAVGLVLFVLFGPSSDDEPAANATESVEEVRDITVIVAARNIPAHTTLTADDLIEETVRSDEVDADAMRNTVEAVGFAYATDLVAGQVLVEANRETPGLANRIEAGRRAYPLLVDGVNLIAGQIRDDDHVDIIFNVRTLLTRVSPSYPLELPDELELGEIEDEDGEGSGISLSPYQTPPEGPTYPFPGEEGSRFWLSDDSGGDPIGKTILQNVRVLRVITPSQLEGTSDDEASYLILDLDPTEAEVMRFLVETGTYQVVLRGPDDQNVAETPGVTLNMLVDNWGMTVPKTVRLPEAGAQ